MAANHRPTITQTQSALRTLREAQESLDAFLDLEGPDTTCALPRDVREAAERYLSSWVQGPLATAVKKMECALEGRPYRSWEE